MATASEDCTASDEIKENESNVSEDLNCSLCLKVFRSPRRLPCSHSFCHDCLQSHISSTPPVQGTVREFCCPICGNVARPETDVSRDKWSYLFPLDTLLLSVLMKAKLKVDLVCNVCQAEDVITPADEVCVVCEEALCRGCSKFHRNQRLSKTHTILKIEELPRKHDVVLHFNSSFNCIKHAHIPVKLYCKTHANRLCSECFVADHSNCPDVVQVIDETPNLLETLGQVKEQLNDVEDKLRRFTMVNDSNLRQLESNLNDLTCEIRALKRSMIDILDNLEKRVRLEGENILNKEKTRTEQRNQCCQSMIMPVRSLNAVLESVKEFSTQTQLFMLVKTLLNQVSLSKSKIEEEHSNSEILTLHMEFNPLLKSVLSLSRDDIARLEMKRNGNVIISDGLKPVKDCRAERVDIIDVKGPDGQMVPWYTDMSYVSHDHMVLVDFRNKRCCLLSSSFNYITSFSLPISPSKICLVKENEVAVSIPLQKAVQFFSVQDKKLTATRKITTRHKCYGISSLSQDEMIVSGPCGDDKTYYWSIFSTEGKENSYHEFDGEGSGQTFIKLNALKTHLYISVYSDNSLHCFGLDGAKYFTFKHHDLQEPQGVDLDRDDNVYVVGAKSKNIFQLSPDGSLIQIIVTNMEKKPIGICFDQNGDKFVITHGKYTNLSVYALKDKNG